MKNLTKLFILFTVFLSTINQVVAQVGIGTTTPDPSAMIDIQSTEKGMLAPRMTALERNAIASPAEGLLVFDTDAKGFYVFNGSTWVAVSGNGATRTNYKLVQSVADLSDELSNGGGSKYLMDENTLYEINGTISFSFPIDLNNAYITGKDSSMDILVSSSGNLFSTSKGGVIKNLSLQASGAAVFNMASSKADIQTLMIRDCLINGSSSVGSIDGYYWVLLDKVSFASNNNGIAYSNIVDLSIESNAWHANNSGTYESFSGEFTAIQKNSGFSYVQSGATALDFSSNPTVDHGVIFGTVFHDMGGTSVLGYSAYVGDDLRNFTEKWVIDCVGLPMERDEIASANMYWDIPIGEFSTTDLGSTNNIVKLNGNIVTTNVVEVTKSKLLFRFESSGANNLEYVGEDARYFQVNCTGSYRPENEMTYVFYVVKRLADGSTLEVDNASRSVRQAESKWNKNEDGGVFTFGITSRIMLEPGESIEVHAQCYDGTGAVDIYSLNFNIF